MNSPRSVELHIEELALHGFAAADSQRIGESFQAEMHRLFGDPKLPSGLTRGGEIALLGDLEITLAEHMRPEAIGTQIARVIFRSLSQ